MIVLEIMHISLTVFSVKQKKDSQSHFPSIWSVIFHIVIPLAFYEVKC